MIGAARDREKRTADSLMRILCFVPELDAGGAQRTLVNLANTFDASGENVVFCAVRAQGPARAWLAPAVPVVDLHKKQVRFAVRPLHACIRKLRPDVVLSTGVDANIVAWLAWRLTGAPRPRLVLRETNSHRARGDIGWLRRHLIAAAYRQADRVIALSEGVRRELIELYGLEPARVVTVYNPVATVEISASAEAARSKPPLWTKTGPTVMAVGRLTYQKGLDRLIEAVAALPIPGVQLVIIGEGNERESLARLANRTGLDERLVMPGYVEDPERWLAHADVFALSSRWEGFGHVIVEAMVAGAPVVAFDCPHGPRDIIRDEVNGLLVKDSDIAGLTAALRRILEQPEFAKQLQHAASVDAAQYSQAAIAKKYLRMFKDLLKSEPSATDARLRSREQNRTSTDIDPI